MKLIDFSNFKKLSNKGNVVAVAQTFPADLETPVSSFLKISGNIPHAFLLESAEQEERIGRYSFLGIKPKAIYESSGNNVIKTQNKSKKILKNTHILNVIENDLKDQKIVNEKSLPGFHGGAVGYLSYENVKYFETIKLSSKKGPKMPLGIFFLVEEFLVFDHFRKTLSIVILVNIKKSQNLKLLYRAALKKISLYREKLSKPLVYPRASKIGTSTSYRSTISAKDFEKKVKRIKEYIRAGDTIQVVLSQRFSKTCRGNDFHIYRSLRSVNPSPYMFYFRSGDFKLIGSSPEMLVKKTGRIAEVRPIAGTRPRGTTKKADERFETQLKTSPKELAEHLMLVDLGRNDLGRVSTFQSVKVSNYAHVERFSHVMHLVSNVTSHLKPGKTSFDLLRAAFPAGTVTGAPKIRAMQIIDELEPETRGPYSGCVGYFGLNGDMDMCITIRTLMVKGNQLYVQAGAGIVKDSNPKREYEETINKAKALITAIEDRILF